MNNYIILGKPSTLAQQIGYDDSAAQSSEALSSTFTAGVGALSDCVLFYGRLLPIYGHF